MDITASSPSSGLLSYGVIENAEVRLTQDEYDLGIDLLNRIG
jgi:hypothetical protein